MSDRPTADVTDNPDESRYEARVGEQLAGILEYRLYDDRVAFTHAEVLPEWEGKGVASQLARQALERTVAQGKLIVPKCPFVVDYVSKHHDFDEHIVEA